MDKNDEVENRVAEVRNAWIKSNNEKKIKQCLYPDHSNCSGKIIKAHAIQNNGVLSQIAVDGDVYMPKARTTDPFKIFTKYGKKQATTFSGFCGYHDVTLFKPIEKDKFSKTSEEIFLYTYRTLTSQLHTKSEAVKQQDIIGHMLTHYDMDLKNTYGQGENDLYYDKCILDKYILDGKKNGGNSPVKSIVWKFEENIDFAGSCYFSPDFGFDGKKVQDITGSKIAHIYVNAFPDNGISYCIISWLEDFHEILEKYVQKLKELSLSEEKNYLNHILVMNTDNLVLSPRLIERFSKAEENNFGMMSQGMSLLESMFTEDRSASNYFGDAGYSLFN